MKSFKKKNIAHFDVNNKEISQWYRKNWDILYRSFRSPKQLGIDFTIRNVLI